MARRDGKGERELEGGLRRRGYSGRVAWYNDKFNEHGMIPWGKRESFYRKKLIYFQAVCETAGWEKFRGESSIFGLF